MVAVDDTGDGYASLSHLLVLRPEFVKLDRGLVQGVDRDPHRATSSPARTQASGNRERARPCTPVVREVPDLVAETTILVDDHGRPRQVLVRVGGRVHGHVAMCVQAGDGVRDVALRAAARQSDDRYGPICVCDELGQPLGIIAIETLLETLARQAPRGADPAGL
jgi:hypothetical protein